MRKELAEVVRFWGWMGESKRNTQGGGGIVVAGVCDVFSEGEGGGIVGVVRVSARIRASGPCLACATPKQGARVCSKGGGGPWGGNLWAGTNAKEMEGGVFACCVSVFPSSLFLLFPPPLTLQAQNGRE